ncbi:hypothetical protein TPHA_0I00220 [Tetrapisispora phaffii CBS 4417]|uniref:Ubiquitin-like domain-containing protein n=1 Tax=Tetrapisispora phaffii (strain ATCC 24235 / CBS 4417 / NBRC 1672 / NRRL Y-8282 / UCD 70-5) TaxID=1071381 RepID=G8BXA1_TETPH|nr:hypothetical protein TPHA_0I00220 [Tetrapisispora phaffii CBS 4417]CCE64529.1 hypothetical protein TPHA_0I00220 [Tetrapisispora phaffii CBS 4417]
MSISVQIKSGQNKWDVAVEPSNTILEFKEIISKASDIPAGNQRLIYSGKILKDAETVESYKIQDGHSIHLVKSGDASANAAKSSTAAAATANAAAGSAESAVPTNITSGQTNGFNPLADLTSARYAGYNLPMPSADMFGPDGGMTNMPNQDDMLSMLENPVFQSQMNEMLSNPQMVEYMINSNPQLQALGPQAREMFQSPFFRQMLTNPDMIRQSMEMARMMGGEGVGIGGGLNGDSSFPAPGETSTESATAEDNAAARNPAATNPAAANPANPFAALFNPGMNPFAGLGNPAAAGSTGAPGTPQYPGFNPSMLASMLQQPRQPAQEDTRPPEVRYESQLRQLNDMGFFEFDRNIAALRRSGGSVQGALDALLNNDV